MIVFCTTVLNIFCRATGDDSTSSPPTEGGAHADGKGSKEDDPFRGDFVSTKNMYRILTVLLTVTVITVFFFLLKGYSSRKNRKTKKYGVLATSGTDVELRPLDDDEEEDEDVTVFDANR